MADARDEHGTVRDLRTGKKVGETNSIDDTFVAYLVALVAEGMEVYVVMGEANGEYAQRTALMRARLLELGIPVVTDPDVKDGGLIVEGKPEEWTDA